MPATFRLDEFAIAPDGALTDRDLTRWLSVGFDLQPAPALPPIGFLVMTDFAWRRAGITGLTARRAGVTDLIPARPGITALEPLGE